MKLTSLFSNSSWMKSFALAPSFGSYISFDLMMKGGTIHLFMASFHSVFSLILYIYSSFIRQLTSCYMKSSSFAWCLTVSSSSSFLSLFSRWISFNSLVAVFSFCFNFFIIHIWPISFKVFTNFV